MITDSFSYVVDTRVFPTSDRVRAFALGDLKEEVFHHGDSVVCEVDLWMKLYTVELEFVIRDGWKRENSIRIKWT